jgi:hypothetical protein
MQDRSIQFGLRQWFASVSALLAAALLAASCGQQSQAIHPVEPITANETSEDMAMLSDRAIFFGHQSVGGNMMQGVEEQLVAQPGAKLKVTAVTAAAEVQGTALFHTMIGQNGDPLGKIEHFEQLVRGGVGERAEVAFLKFCYIDFTPGTDVRQVFESYKRAMAVLAQDYPGTTFVHLTVPLTVEGSGIKYLAKRLLGRHDDSLGNPQRQQFNELLRREYAGKEPLFDLAKLEATAPDGRLCQMTLDGQTVPCMYAGYTDDGGHLNEQGRSFVAKQLLAFLAGLEVTSSATAAGAGNP